MRFSRLCPPRLPALVLGLFAALPVVAGPPLQIGTLFAGPNEQGASSPITVNSSVWPSEVSVPLSLNGSHTPANFQSLRLLPANGMNYVEVILPDSVGFTQVFALPASGVTIANFATFSGDFNSLKTLGLRYFNAGFQKQPGFFSVGANFIPQGGTTVNFSLSQNHSPPLIEFQAPGVTAVALSGCWTTTAGVAPSWHPINQSLEQVAPGVFWISWVIPAIPPQTVNLCAICTGTAFNGVPLRYYQLVNLQP